MQNQMNPQEKMALALRDFRRLTNCATPEVDGVYLVLWQSPEEENKILNQTGETDLRGRRIKIKSVQPFVVGGKRADTKSFVINGLVSVGSPDGNAAEVAGLRFCFGELMSKKDRKSDFED